MVSSVVVTAQNSKDKLEKLGAVDVLLVTLLRLPGTLCQDGPANTGQCTDSHTFPTSVKNEVDSLTDDGA